MSRLRQMDTAEWGIVAIGLALIGFGLWTVSASPHQPWRALGYLLVALGILGSLLAVVGYPLFVRFATAAALQARKRGYLTAPLRPTVDVSTAMRFLSTELEIARASVKRLLSEGKFPRGVTPLPLGRWREYEDVVAREAPEVYADVARAYVRIEEFNRMTVDRANLYVSRWLSFHDDDDMDGFMRALADAIAALRAAMSQ